MRRTTEGTEISFNDDPVIIAEALNAAVVFDKAQLAVGFVDTNPDQIKDTIFSARKLENQFHIWDGEFNPVFEDESIPAHVEIKLQPEDLLGALAAYGANFIPPIGESSRTMPSSEKIRQQEAVLSGLDEAHAARLHRTIDRVLQVIDNDNAA